MAITRDIRNHEQVFLQHMVELTDKTVLEVGCGDGRLTRLYQPLPDRIIGIDMDFEILHTAQATSQDHVDFALSDAVKLPFRDQSFDVVIFAWSL